MNRIRSQVSWVSDPVHPVNPVRFLTIPRHIPLRGCWRGEAGRRASEEASHRGAMRREGSSPSG